MPELGRRPFAPQYRFAGIGTHWRVASPRSAEPQVCADIDRRVEEFDRTWSRFRDDSVVSVMARTSGTYVLPAEAATLMSLYRSLYDLTGGAMTPLVGRALEHLGYDAEYSLQRRPGSLRTPPWDAVLTVQGSTITTTRPLLLDVGAAGKGLLVDLLADLVDPDHEGDLLIDGSGDLLHRGDIPCRVGLEHPLDETMVIGVAELSNASLCSSAVNRRRWGSDLHHVVDPFTGEPIRGTLATWVVAETTAVADGLATALFFTDPAVLTREYAFSYVRMSDDGSVDYSTNFPGELF